MKTFNINRSLTILLAVGLAVPYSVIAFMAIGVPFIPVLIINIITFTLLINNLLLFKHKQLRFIYIIINLIGLVLLVYNAKYRALPMAGVDWYNFDNFAKTAIANSKGFVSLYNNSIDLFSFLVALIYKAFGANAGQVYFFIFPVASIIFRYVYKTVLLVSKKVNIAEWASIAIIALPLNIIFSVSFLRQIPIQALVIISFYNLVKYIRYDKSKNIIGALLCIAGAAMMHSGMAGILIVYIYVLLQKKLFKNYKIFRIRAIIIAGLCVAFVSMTPIWGSITKRFASIGGTNDVVSSLEMQNKYLVANTQYISSVPQNITEIILSAPYRFIMFMFSPLIWQVYDAQTFLAFLIDGIPQIIIIFIIIKILKNYKFIPKNDRIIIISILLSVLITYLIFSFGTNNYGTAMRHRTTVLPLLIVFIFSYYKYIPKRLKNV